MLRFAEIPNNRLEFAESSGFTVTSNVTIPAVF
jgi:hypothetical protein